MFYYKSERSTLTGLTVFIYIPHFIDLDQDLQFLDVTQQNQDYTTKSGSVILFT